MNKAMVMALALGVTMLASSAIADGVDARSAQYGRDGGGYHDRDDDRWNQDRDDRNDRNRGDRGYGSRRGNWDSEFEGEWQRSRRDGSNRGGWLGGWGPFGRNRPDAMLPNQIRIESSRGGLRVETASGVKLRARLESRRWSERNARVRDVGRLQDHGHADVCAECRRP